MANTFKKIQTVTVGSGGAATIDFTSIPQTYTDLKLVMSLRSTRATYVDDDFQININGLTTNQTTRYLQGSGAGSAGSFTGTRWSGLIPADGAATASVFGSAELYIPNYTSANNKSSSIDSVHETNGTTAYQRLHANLWSQTDAITRLTIVCADGNFKQYSTATLYGVSNVNIGSISSSPYATGGTVTSNGQYYIHTFTSDGTFTPNQALTCDYLVVAGGGAGENTAGGGGGAGGLRSTTTATGGGGSLESRLSLTSGTPYTVTIGGGGAGSPSVSATSGFNSVFSTITSTGGGAGGPHRFGSGVAGGSGGGSGGGDDAGSPGGQTGGAGTANQGYAGGNSTSNANRGGGGGGGAGAVGAVGGSPTGGNGGNGVAISISGTSTFYAGGGGGAGCATAFGGGVSPGGAGGAGGTGGGGTGGRGTTNANLTAGTTNTGGGGGGGGYDGTNILTGANGGSGIVIVRYTI
jgi:hypothetical protein